MNGADSLAHRYKEVDVNTSSPLQLVVMLYEGAILSLQQARDHIRNEDIEGRSKAINRCIAIITELQSCLNLKEGGEIAGSLDRLYDYMKRRICKANVDQSGEPLKEVEGLLENLCSAWRELANRQPNDFPAHSGQNKNYSNPGNSVKASTVRTNSLNISI